VEVDPLSSWKEDFNLALPIFKGSFELTEIVIVTVFSLKPCWYITIEISNILKRLKVDRFLDKYLELCTESSQV